MELKSFNVNNLKKILKVFKGENNIKKENIINKRKIIKKELINFKN